LSVSIGRGVTPSCPQKGRLDRAEALTVRLLWMVWISVEKAQKASPTASPPS
jgi:hypothetical protein